jgi:hypothetical protein
MTEASPISEGRMAITKERLLSALLLMVIEYCGDTNGVLDSWERPGNTQAMRLLAESGFLRIDEDDGERVRAIILPEADAFLARMAECP